MNREVRFGKTNNAGESAIRKIVIDLANFGKLMDTNLLINKLLKPVEFQELFPGSNLQVCDNVQPGDR